MAENELEIKDAAKYDLPHTRNIGIMKYVERHYGEGSSEGSRVLNPVTFVEAESGSLVELEMVQIGGIDSTERKTTVRLHDNAKLILTERLLTSLAQRASSRITIELVGAGSSAQVISRSVARDASEQEYFFDLVGRNECRGHIQCDAILLDTAKVSSTPKISALDSRALLVHAAARLPGRGILYEKPLRPPRRKASRAQGSDRRLHAFIDDFQITIGTLPAPNEIPAF